MGFPGTAAIGKALPRSQGRCGDHNWRWRQNVWGRLAAKLAGVPVICSALHSTGWPDGVGKLNRLLTPITSGFIACASGQAEFLAEFEKFPANRVFMIPNGVDVERFAPCADSYVQLRSELNLSQDAKLIGIVAALREEKNHEQFVVAANEVLKKHPNTHFVIVGDGPERNAIVAKVEELGLGEHIHLLGSRSDTPHILAGLDIFCLTSRNEAKPVSILEALACGVPAVSPDVGSVSESVIHNETGFLTEPLSSSGTANAIVQLLDNPSLMQQMGSNGRQHVIENSSLDGMVLGYQDLMVRLYNQHCQKTNAAVWEPPQSAQRMNNVTCEDNPNPSEVFPLVGCSSPSSIDLTSNC